MPISLPAPLRPNACCTDLFSKCLVETQCCFFSTLLTGWHVCEPWHMHWVSLNMQVQKTTSGHHTEPHTFIRACELTLWWINAVSWPHFHHSVSRWRQLLETDSYWNEYCDAASALWVAWIHFRRSTMLQYRVEIGGGLEIILRPGCDNKKKKSTVW